MIAPIEEGGLAMPDVKAIHEASKIGWFRRIHDKQDSKWKNVMIYMLNINKDIINRPLPPSWTNKCRTKFHKQLLECWLKLYDQEPKDIKYLYTQYITHNRYIKINNKEINNSITRCSDSHTLIIKDFIDTEQNIKPYHEFKRTYNTKMNILEYNSIISAIPKSWKQKIRTNKTHYTVCTSELYIELTQKSEPIEIKKLTNKLIYLSLIKNKTSLPTAIEHWINIFPFLETHNWSQTYKLTSTFTKESYLQSFQYKVLNRILNCKERLYRWGISDENACKECKVVDTLEHHLFDCKLSKNLWLEIELNG